MSNMLSSSGNSPPQPPPTLMSVFTAMAWTGWCLCARACARLCDPSLLIRTHLSGLCLIIYIQRGHFVRAASSAASHPPACQEEHVTPSCLWLFSSVWAGNGQNNPICGKQALGHTDVSLEELYWSCVMLSSVTNNNLHVFTWIDHQYKQSSAGWGDSYTLVVLSLWKLNKHNVWPSH